MTVYDNKKPSTVYLRPTPKSRPVRYIESIEEAAMIVDQKHAIAMYTSKTVPNTGPQGPPGEPGEPYRRDTIIAAASDEFSAIPLTGGLPMTTFRAPYPLDLREGYIRASLTTAPQGDDMVIEVRMNGSPMFDVPIYIDENTRSSVDAAIQSVISDDSLDVPDDAEFTVFCLQIGSLFAGSGLKISITGFKVV